MRIEDDSIICASLEEMKELTEAIKNAVEERLIFTGKIVWKERLSKHS